MLSDCIEYEKFFIKDNQFYFIITISKMESAKFMDFIQIEKFNICKTLNEIIDIKSFKKILVSVINFFMNFDQAEINEKDIRMDLINYSALAYSSYNLVKDKSDIVEILNDLYYKEYYEYIFDKVIK